MRVTLDHPRSKSMQVKLDGVVVKNYVVADEEANQVVIYDGPTTSGIPTGRYRIIHGLVKIIDIHKVKR